VAHAAGGFNQVGSVTVNVAGLTGTFTDSFDVFDDQLGGFAGFGLTSGGRFFGGANSIFNTYNLQTSIAVSCTSECDDFPFGSGSLATSSGPLDVTSGVDATFTATSNKSGRKRTPHSQAQNVGRRHHILPEYSGNYLYT